VNPPVNEEEKEKKGKKIKSPGLRVSKIKIELLALGWLLLLVVF
jgi:hypothetical protein